MLNSFQQLKIVQIDHEKSLGVIRSHKDREFIWAKCLAVSLFICLSVNFAVLQLLVQLKTRTLSQKLTEIMRLKSLILRFGIVYVAIMSLARTILKTTRARRTKVAKGSYFLTSSYKTLRRNNYQIIICDYLH